MRAIQKEVRDEAVKMYLAPDKPLAYEIAEKLGICTNVVLAAIKETLSPKQFKEEKALRYRRDKLGKLNPLSGKNGTLHPNWKGDCSDGKGYLTRIVDGERYLAHRIVMAEMIGIHVKDLPMKLDVHHIDEDGMNNEPENLALVTRTAHRQLHLREWLLTKLFSLVKETFGISKLKKMDHI
jgi:hypothetical protein